MKVIRMSYKEDDFRQAIVFDNVSGANLNGIIIPAAKELCVMLFNDAKGLSMNNISLPVNNNKGIVRKNPY
jgi:hypothetical protein